jgi:hypothetical protein
MSPSETAGADVYVYREKKNGDFGLARPCNFCYSILLKMRIRRVIYTTESYPYYAIEKLNDMKNLKQYIFEEVM